MSHLRICFFALVIVFSSTVSAKDTKLKFEDMVQMKTLAEQSGIKRNPSSRLSYSFDPYCNDGQTPVKKDSSQYDTCEVYNITHYSGETIVELQKCFRVCNASVRISKKDRNDFVLSQLFNIYSIRKTAGKVTQATIDLEAKKISQVFVGQVRPDSVWID